MPQRAVRQAPPPTVVIVNDSPVARAVQAGVVQASGAYRLVGQATTGKGGIELILAQRPQLVLLDMHMPDMTGVEVTRRVMRKRPTRILICSATIQRNTPYLFEALGQGALDYTRTPVLDAQPGQTVGREQLLRAGAALLRKMGMVLSLPLRQAPAGPLLSRPERPATAQKASSPPKEPEPALPAHGPLPLVLVGCSTGGPTALNRLLQVLAPGFYGAVLVSQHIEREFTEGLALWLVRQTGHRVKVAEDGEVPVPGWVYLAKGGRTNLVVTLDGRLAYEPSGAAIYYPNIDRLFTTAAECAGRNCCSVVLTGLGDDGSRGLARVSWAGGHILVQEPSTATVDGMPRAAMQRAGLDRGYGLAELGLKIGRWLEGIR